MKHIYKKYKALKKRVNILNASVVGLQSRIIVLESALSRACADSSLFQNNSFRVVYNHYIDYAIDHLIDCRLFFN